MSTDVDTPETTKHELTRGALQLIIRLSARTEPFKKAGSTKRWLRLCRRLKAGHSTKTKVGDTEVDVDKKFIRLSEDTDVTWAQRTAAFEDAFKAWECEKVTIELTTRERALLEKAVKWALKDRTSPKAAWPFNDENILSIMEAFKGVCEDLDEGGDDDEDAEKDD